MIEVKDLVKRYGGHTAVDGLTFTVEKGQVYGFLGPNGAGKSTTMNIMTGYLSASEGEVFIDGHNITDQPIEAKKRLGYLPEQPPLYGDMTVSEYLKFVCQVKRVPKAEMEARLSKIMDAVKLSDVSGRLIRNLSKGYKQRTGLAQALLGEPDVIILDEPTVGLDPRQILEIRSLIRDLAQDHTVILSSHILSEVQETCDHILIMHHGKMIASGSPGELEQQMAASAALELCVKGSQEQAVAALSQLDGVKELTLLKGCDPAGVLCRIQQESGRDVRETIFHACAQANLPIMMLKQTGVTLEEIFLALTSDDPAPPSAPENPSSFPALEGSEKAREADSPEGGEDRSMEESDSAKSDEKEAAQDDGDL